MQRESQFLGFKYLSMYIIFDYFFIVDPHTHTRTHTSKKYFIFNRNYNNIHILSQRSIFVSFFISRSMMITYYIFFKNIFLKNFFIKIIFLFFVHFHIITGESKYIDNKIKEMLRFTNYINS